MLYHSDIPYLGTYSNSYLFPFQILKIVMIIMYPHNIVQQESVANAAQMASQSSHIARPRMYKIFAPGQAISEDSVTTP